jgi:hypothetical protein
MLTSIKLIEIITNIPAKIKIIHAIGVYPKL